MASETIEENSENSTHTITKPTTESYANEKAPREEGQLVSKTKDIGSIPNTPKKSSPIVSRSQLDPALLAKESWEDDVVVFNVLCTDIAREYTVILKWHDGKMSAHASKETKIRCPLRMVEFYEQIMEFH